MHRPNPRRYPELLFNIRVRIRPQISDGAETVLVSNIIWPLSNSPNVCQ